MLWEVRDGQSGKRVRRAVYKTPQGAQRRAEQLGAERYKVRASALPEDWQAIVRRMRVITMRPQPGYRS